MRKNRIIAAALAIMMLLSVTAVSFALSEKEWAWRYLSNYAGGKNGCTLKTYSDGSKEFYASMEDDSTGSTWLYFEPDIFEWGYKIFIGIYVCIAEGSSVRSDYDISRITIKADGTEFYWVDLVNNNRDSRFYTTTPGMYFICPEIAVWQQLASASNISVSVTAYRYGSGQTFNITPNGCNAFREFARAIVNNNLHDLCDLGDMNAAGQVYPMRTTVTSVSYRDGQQLRVINCNSSISLRTQPDPDAPRICMIPKGEYVTYRGNAGNGFYLVEYGRYMGYASSLYLGR